MDRWAMSLRWSWAASLRTPTELASKTLTSWWCGGAEVTPRRRRCGVPVEIWWFSDSCSDNRSRIWGFYFLETFEFWGTFEIWETLEISATFEISENRDHKFEFFFILWLWLILNQFNILLNKNIFNVFTFLIFFKFFLKI